MKTCYISRFGAYGDLLHASHLPRLIKDYYRVDTIDFETSYQGYQILQNNPYVDNLIFTDVSKLTQNRMQKNWEHCKENYDLFFNLVYTIEKEYCTIEFDNRYYRNEKWRRDHCGKMNYYDVMTAAAGLPECYFGQRGMLYYDDIDHQGAQEWIKSFKEKNNVDWLVLVCLSGSSLHKKFQQAEEVCRSLLDKHPQAYIILVGDQFCECQLFEHPRVSHKIQLKDKDGKITHKGWNFRTTMLMAKYFDFVVSPETGLVCVSHMWDTPTLQLLTAASWDNHIKYAKNAYWVKSPVSCSPCHRSPFKYYGCPRKEDLPACVFFNVPEILDKIEEAYEHYTKVRDSREMVPAGVSDMR